MEENAAVVAEVLGPYSLKKLREAIIEDMLRLWGKPPEGCKVVASPGKFAEDFFGDGSDGDYDLNGPDAALTRDKFFRNLTIRAGGALATAGHRVFVKEKLTIESTGKLGAWGDSSNGGTMVPVPWSGTSGAGGYRGYTLATGTNATAGAAGGTGDTALKTYGPSCLLSGGGGGGGGYVGDAATGTAPVAGISALGADGGAGGAGTSDGSSVDLDGGLGGGGGGVVMVYAREIDNAGKINANGADGEGGQVSGGSSSGAGGGGGGGVVILYYERTSGSGVGTVEAPGGAAGTPGGAATAGSNGTVHTYQVKV